MLTLRSHHGHTILPIEHVQPWYKHIYEIESQVNDNKPALTRKTMPLVHSK